MAAIAEELGWTPLSIEDTSALTPPMGVIPGVHRAWRIGNAPSDVVVEVGGTGAWSFASQDDARSRGERLMGPVPNVAEPGADRRFGFSNHWICVVHFRGGEPDAIVSRIIDESVRGTEVGSPLTTFEHLDNRPGWSSVDWFVRSERSTVSFTYSRGEAGQFDRELSLGYFTPFDGEAAE